MSNVKTIIHVDLTGFEAVPVVADMKRFFTIVARKSDAIPEKAEVTFNGANLDDVRVTVRGRVIKTDGERDMRFNSLVTLWGHGDLEAEIAADALRTLKQEMADMFANAST